jgi:LacI family transcriptional regulator
LIGCWTIQIQSAQQTLDGIPKPLAVLSANDMRGLQVIDACSLLEIQVPEEVSVLGVNNGLTRMALT